MREKINTVLLVVIAALLAAIVFKPNPEIGRFQLLHGETTTLETRVLLDTKTGQLCRTEKRENDVYRYCPDLADE